MNRSHGQPPAEAPDQAAAPEPGPASVTASTATDVKRLAGLVREELQRLTKKLGEDIIGGPRHPRREDGSHRVSDLETLGRKGREALRARLEDWSAPSGPGRVLLLVCLWEESWRLLDYSLAYHTLEVAERAAADFTRHAAPLRAGQVTQDWEAAALRAVSQAMSLITTDATLFKLINLSSAEGLKAAAERAVRDTSDIASALKTLGQPPFESDDGRLLAAKLGEIEATASQNNVFYAALLRAAEALIEFEGWLERAPRLTPGRLGAPVAGRPDSAPEQALAAIDAAIEHFRGDQATISDLLILSRYEPWERLLVETREIVEPSDPDTVSHVFVPKRVSVRYLYPFAVEESETAGILLDEPKSGSIVFDDLRTDLNTQLKDIGIEVGELRALEPTELFAQGSGLYGGVRVSLPDLEFSPQPWRGSGGDGQERFQVWITLSSMGNHCLCIERREDLVEPLPHVLYRTLQAGTPFAIGATVALAGRSGQAQAAWDHLFSFSRDVIAAIARASFWRVPPGLPVAERFMCGNLHEIVVARTGVPLGTHPEAIAHALDRAVGGRILGRSIQRAATTLEEWVRYPPVPRAGTADYGAASAIAGIPEMGLAGDWCTHTGETSVFGVVAAPSWHSDQYLEGAQFANSWSPRLQLWSGRLRSTIQSLESDSRDDEGAERLRDVERRVRLHLAQINTEELTGTLGHRRFLDELLRMAGLSRLQADLGAQLEAGERLADWFNQQAYENNEQKRRADEEVRQKADRRRQVLLGIITLFGLFGLAGFLSLANSTGFHMGFLSFAEQRGAWEDWVMVALVLIAVAVGLYLYNGHVENAVRGLGSRTAASVRRSHALSARIRFRDLRADADTSLIEAVYRDILESSFNHNELETLDVIVDGLTEGGRYECWGLCALDGDEPVGCVLGYPYLVSGVLLIGYLAVRPSVRGRGVGRTLLDEAKRRWYGKTGLSLVVAEVEDPRYHEAARGIDPERRIAFFARREAQLVIGPYLQPRLDESMKRVPHMFLAVLDGGGRASVPSPQIATFLTEYFRTTAEDRDWPLAEDAEGHWLFDWYHDRDTVRLQPIDKYATVEIPSVPGR
jgi:predicted N-acetyltransferase YhbS